MFKYAIWLVIHENKSLLAICLQNPAWLHTASLGNFHGKQTQMLVGTKNSPLFSWNKIQNKSIFSDIHTKVQKYLLSTALCGMP